MGSIHPLGTKFMERDGYTDDTKIFISTEVEKSPAYGQRTLFVIGVQNPKEI